MRYAVAMDVGGTSLSAAVVAEDGSIPEASFQQRSIDANANQESILARFASTLIDALDYARQAKLDISGIALSICGPFDYEQGISLIKGLDKYDSLYGVNVKEALRQRLKLTPSFPLIFDVDAWCFARGEAWLGIARDYQRILVLTLGTGVGSAFVTDGMVVDQGEGVPWLGWIAGQAYKASILNDYVSRSAMMTRYTDLSGQHCDVKAMAERAMQGDVLAKQVFDEIASELAHFIKDRHVIPFQADCIVLGGQIAKSFSLFQQPFETIFADVPTLKAIVPASDIERSALCGAAKLIFDQTLDKKA